MNPSNQNSRDNQERQSLKYLGSYMRKWRENLGYTQEQFASIADLTRSYITEIETGKRNISFLNFIKIIKVLKVNPQDLIELFQAIQGLREK